MKKKQKKYGSYLIATLLLVFSGIFYHRYNQEVEKQAMLEKFNRKMGAHNHQGHNHDHHNHNHGPKRKIASVRKFQDTPAQVKAQKWYSTIDSQIQTSFIQGNKKRKAWIELIDSSTLKKDNVEFAVDHIRVNLKNEKGLESRYEAFVDKRTSKIIMTWNKTRYEFPEKLKLQGSPL